MKPPTAGLMHMRKYSLAETFLTVQGEGFNAGTVAFFVRFAGCNLWRGTELSRQDDAERNGALCPLFCDTDFAPKAKLTHEDLVSLIATHDRVPLVVFTGGEPLLQLSPELVADALRYADMVAIETNGTQTLHEDLIPYFNQGKLWVTCSPKVPWNRLTIDPRDISELKVVYPAYDPKTYEGWVARSKLPPGRLFVQPEAVPLAQIGKSSLDNACMQNAAQFVIRNPQWRLSIQGHKVVNLP